MNILFNEIAPEMHIFCATRIEGYMFLQHCNSGQGGHKIFDHQIGGSQKYCRGTFGNSWPPNSKENGGPLTKVKLYIKIIFRLQDIGDNMGNYGN